MVLYMKENGAITQLSAKDSFLMPQEISIKASGPVICATGPENFVVSTALYLQVNGKMTSNQGMERRCGRTRRSSMDTMREG